MNLRFFLTTNADVKNSDVKLQVSKGIQIQIDLVSKPSAESERDQTKPLRLGLWEK
jgi:hypothetical protein